MARTTISIPDELKARMDERTGINWSAVAQRAFELQLNATAKGDNSMNAVIERLRASKAIIEAAQRPEFTERGKEWAKNEAAYDQLLAVAQINVDSVDEDDNPAERLFWTLSGAIFDDELGIGLMHPETREFVTGDEDTHPSLQAMKWWIEGAVDIWDSVKGQL